jgi:gluconolactonase
MMKSRLLFPPTGRNTAATKALLTLMILLLAVPAPPLVAQQSDRKYELHANSPAFWKLVSRDAKLQTVATGFGFTEGAVWDPAGFLYVSDETLNKIFSIELE